MSTGRSLRTPHSLGSVSLSRLCSVYSITPRIKAGEMWIVFLIIDSASVNVTYGSVCLLPCPPKPPLEHSVLATYYVLHIGGLYCHLSIQWLATYCVLHTMLDAYLLSYLLTILAFQEFKARQGFMCPAHARVAQSKPCLPEGSPTRC